MRLYIRNHPDEITQTWWNNFEQSLVDRFVGTDALQHHIVDRREKLNAHGALLQYEKSTGLPYLKFKNEKSLIWFLLKWS